MLYNSVRRDHATSLHSDGVLVVLCPRGIAGRDDIVVVWQGKKEEED